MELVDKSLLQYPMYVHLDMSVSGDKTGLDGMDKLLCDLAAYGCKHYTTKITEDAADNTTC